MKKLIFLILLLNTFILSVNQSNAQNLINDGTFSTTSYITRYYEGVAPANVWSTYQGYLSVAYPYVWDGVCNFLIFKEGCCTWDITLAQGGIALIAGHSYRLSFDVRADADRSFGVYLGHDGDPWIDFIGYDRYTYNATTDWQTITIDFKVPVIFDDHKLSFELGSAAINTFFDNVYLQDLGEYIPTVGIFGPAYKGWENNLDMITTDNVHYTLANIPLKSDYIKFLFDRRWEINWGNSGFPSGTGIFLGPDIPALEGVYNIYFNRITGEYRFVATSCPIAGIQCPEDQIADSSPGVCGAYVYYPDVKAAPNCGGEGITIVQTGGLPSGSLFPVGVTTNTFVLTNATGNSATCSFRVTVSDVEPPVIGNAAAIPDLLWPVNHGLITVNVNYTVHDNCDSPLVNRLYISNSETGNESGDGNTAIDAEVVDEHHILLRAERSGKGTGRTYSVLIECCDQSGNCSSQELTVFIPHDQRTQVTDNDSDKKNNIRSLVSPVKSAKIETSGNDHSFVMRIWPNPGNRYFNLDVQGLPEWKTGFSLFDSAGRLVLQKDITDESQLRFGEELTPGTYFVEVKQGLISKTVKVLKK